MRTTAFLFTRPALAVLLTVALASFTVPVHAQGTARVSVTPDGLQAQAHSTRSAISSDGRLVVFQSTAWNLVPADTDGNADIFVHDRQTGTTSLVSVGVAEDSSNEDPAMSSDGSLVAFESWTVPMEGYNMTELFLRDRLAGTTTSVLVHPNGGGFDLNLSADGRYLTFASDEESLVSGDTNGVTDVFVFEVLSGTFELASVDSSGAQADSYSYAPSLSGDGRYVAFVSAASNLVSGDTNGNQDVFVHDRLTGATSRVSVSTTGIQANSDNTDPDISADGTRIAFRSYASNLVTGDVNGAVDVFIHDAGAGTTVLVSVSSTGTQANAESYGPSLSGDGAHVAFASYATNLVPNDTNATFDAFLHELATGITSLVSCDSAGAHGNGQSWPTSISYDGSQTTFYSQADGLVAGDTNAVIDVFVRDLALDCEPLRAYCTAKINSLGCTPTVGASGLPTTTGFDAFFLTAESILSNQFGIFFWGTAPASNPFFGGTLCVAAPIVRTPVQNSGGNPPPFDCSGSFSFHFSQAIMQAHGLTSGTTVYGQYWCRDPGFPPPNSIGLSDGIEFTLCP
jgi:Tol biopolymer transport system component